MKRTMSRMANMTTITITIHTSAHAHDSHAFAARDRIVRQSSPARVDFPLPNALLDAKLVCDRPHHGPQEAAPIHRQHAATATLDEMRAAT